MESIKHKNVEVKEDNEMSTANIKQFFRFVKLEVFNLSNGDCEVPNSFFITIRVLWIHGFPILAVEKRHFQSQY